MILKLYGTQGLWYSSSMVLKLHGTQALWYSSSMVLKLYGTQALWYSSSMVLKLYGTQALWYSSSMVLYGTILFLLTHTGFTIIGESVSRPAVALDLQVTQVITNLFTATIVKLTQVCQGTWNREDRLVNFK